MDRDIPDRKPVNMTENSASQEHALVATRDQRRREAERTAAGPSKLQPMDSAQAEGSVTKRKKRRKPWGLKWRSSTWYITAVVAMSVCSDALAYQIIVPVLPYRLESLGYTGVSAKTSWLTFAFSIGIFITTFPVAYYFARFPYRRVPLVVAVCILEGSQILFMLAKPYAALVVARFLMGCSSTVVWVVGFALLVENVDEAQIGRQIGFAISGVSIGTTIAPPIGGALYSHLGWYAPFIFILAICAFDLCARLLVIERKTLLRYQLDDPADDPRTEPSPSLAEEGERDASDENTRGRPSEVNLSDARPRPRSKTPAKTPYIPPKVKSDLSPWRVLVELGRSPRGMGGFVLTFVFGFVLGVTDPTLTLRIQDVWHKNSDFVGLAYLAASAPSFITGPIVGALADRFGAEWILAPGLLLSIPWLPLMMLKSSLAGVVVYFALNITFLNCALGPVGLELAIAAREVEGMSEIHQFSAMNLSFSISTAIGSVIGGQIYDHLENGWAAVCWFMFAFCLAALPVPFFTGGKQTLWDHCKNWRKVQNNPKMATEPHEPASEKVAPVVNRGPGLDTAASRDPPSPRLERFPSRRSTVIPMSLLSSDSPA